MSAETIADRTMSEAVADEHVVGPVSDFPLDTHKVVKVGRMELGIFNAAGTFHALPNICPHQFGPLSKGPVGGAMICDAKTNWKFQWGFAGEILTCPWHGLEFEIKTGTCIAAKKFSVRTYPVRVVDGEVRVRLTPNKPAEAAVAG